MNERGGWVGDDDDDDDVDAAMVDDRNDKYANNGITLQDILD